jgi:hypothetical protein
VRLRLSIAIGILSLVAAVALFLEVVAPSQEGALHACPFDLAD